jgi:hypothetical protein
MSDLDETLKPLGDPRLPVWVPRWRFESDTDRHHAEATISAAMPTSSPVVAIVVARRIEDLPIAVRAVATPGERGMVESMTREMADASTWMRFCQGTTTRK